MYSTTQQFWPNVINRAHNLRKYSKNTAAESFLRVRDTSPQNKENL